VVGGANVQSARAASFRPEIMLCGHTHPSPRRCPGVVGPPFHLGLCAASGHGGAGATIVRRRRAAARGLRQCRRVPNTSLSNTSSRSHHGAGDPATRPVASDPRLRSRVLLRAWESCSSCFSSWREPLNCFRNLRSRKIERPRRTDGRNSSRRVIRISISTSGKGRFLNSSISITATGSPVLRRCIRATCSRVDLPAPLRPVIR
jgi:hypothetical protein